MAFVDILKHSGIIIKVVYHALFFCFRLSTCSICSLWSESVWALADESRIHSKRKSVMTKKRHNRKKQIVVSDAPEDNSVDGSTTLQGYTARGETHLGGNFMVLRASRV